MVEGAEFGKNVYFNLEVPKELNKKGTEMVDKKDVSRHYYYEDYKYADLYVLNSNEVGEINNENGTCSFNLYVVKGNSVIKTWINDVTLGNLLQQNNDFEQKFVVANRRPYILTGDCNTNLLFFRKLKIRKTLNI